MATGRHTFSNTTVLVTGAAKRLGRAISLALAAEGANVAIHYGTSHAEAESLAEEVRGMGAKAWTIQADLAESDAGLRLFEGAVALAGGIDFLVNNASIFPVQSFAALEESTLLENVRVNSLAPLELAKAFYAQGRPGAVLNLLDTRILDYDKVHVPYHLSKRMLFSLTKIMALEFAPEVRVNAVAPGLVLPPPGEDEAYLRRMAAELPLRRHGSAEDVADAALYLLASPFVTGQVLYVDGGRHLGAQLYG